MVTCGTSLIPNGTVLDITGIFPSIFCFCRTILLGAFLSLSSPFLLARKKGFDDGTWRPKLEIMRKDKKRGNNASILVKIPLNIIKKRKGLPFRDLKTIDKKTPKKPLIKQVVNFDNLVARFLIFIPLQ